MGASVGTAVDIEDLDAQWLSGVLGAEVRDLRVERVGTGQTAATYLLELDGEGVPRSLIAKVAAGPVDGRAVVANGYRNEVNFYKHLRPLLEARTPECLHVVMNDDATHFTLLLEDLSPRSAGTQVDGCPLERAPAAVANLAGLHGPLWGLAPIAHLDHLKDPTVEDAEFLGAVAVGAADTFLDRYDGALSAATVDTMRLAAEAMGQWLLARPQIRSVIHGDYRPDNLMFGEALDDVVTVDWQTVSVGLPTRDLAYFLGTSLSIEDRRTHERDLVAHYCAELERLGVRDYSEAECFDDYRLGHLQGPLITTLGAVYSPAERTDAADAMFLAMAERSCAAIRDLDSLSLL